MRKTRRLSAAILAILVSMSLCLPAWGAADADAETGEEEFVTAVDAPAGEETMAVSEDMENCETAGEAVSADDGSGANENAAILPEQTPDAEAPAGETEETEPEEELLQAPSASVVYRTHCQTYGWFPWVRDGEEGGITGQSKRMEAMNIYLENASVSGSIEYRTHCQTYGWLGWVRDGQLTGTTGQSKRLEAIQIRLTGDMAKAFDVYYRVHCQTFGWMGWAKNGEPSGSAGYSKRLEAIEIQLVAKGGPAPGSTANAYVSAYGDAAEVGAAGNTLVEYCTHVQTYGWQDYVSDGQMSGTSGESKRLEGIRIRLANQKYSGNIQYRTHVQTYGWQDFVQNGAMSGTEGESKRLEAIEIRLTGKMAEQYDVYYRVHCQTFGWMGWAKNGEPAGTAGYSKRLEGIEIRLVSKGSAAPGSTADAYRQYTAPKTTPASVTDTTVMSEANWQVLINVIGAVESGGQIYGNRNYGAYAGRYAASPYEYTCTLGWAQFYGSRAQKLVQNILNANPFVFRSIDTGGVIEKKLSTDWVSARWDPSASEKNTLIRLITSDVGKQQQDLLFRSDVAPIVAYCENTYTKSAKAVIMYTEIAHLGGSAAANRIFNRCGGDYSTNRILASLKLDQSDYSNNQQVGDSMYNLRHAKCAEFVEKYVQ